MYQYDSSLITGDVTGAHKYLSFVNVIYIRFAINCTNSQGGDRPRFQNIPGLILQCHTYIPGWRRLQTHTHTQCHITNTNYGIEYHQVLGLFCFLFLEESVSCITLSPKYSTPRPKMASMNSKARVVASSKRSKVMYSSRRFPGSSFCQGH